MLFKCTMAACDLIFDSKNKLNQHKRTHTSASKYKW